MTARTVVRNRLRLWRVRSGFTLDEVADLVGYSKGFLSRVERGERELSVEGKVHVARCLGAPIRDLFDVPRAVDEAGAA